MRFVFVFSLILTLYSCAPKQKQSSPLVFETTQTPIHNTPIEIPRMRTGVLARAELHQVLDQGVGRFLGRLEVQASLGKQHFRGWKILQFDNPWVDLLPGDVVTSVNNHPLERPHQVQALWKKLYTAKEIRIEVLRKQSAFTLLFRVEGATFEASP